MTGFKSQFDPEFWQVRVRITQGPVKQEKEVYFDIRNHKKYEIDKTWLHDYFHDQTVYGLELTAIGNQIIWEFFLTLLEPKNGLEKANALLNFLKNKFPGVSGTIDIVPIYPFMFKKECKYKIFEFEIPSLMFLQPKLPDFDTLSIIQNFIQINRFNHHKNKRIRLIVLWQANVRDTSNIISLLQITPGVREYKVKLFLRVDFKHKSNDESKYQDILFKSGLLYLVDNVYNIHKKKGYLKEVSLNKWKDILKGQIDWENLITPKSFDFSFPVNSGLSKSFILENEHIIDLPIDELDKNYVCFGKIVRQGVLTEDKTYVNINDFSQSCIIAGATGTGKTKVASLIVNEISKKASQVGILSIGLSKKYEFQLFKPDKILKYGDKELQIPYFIKPIHEYNTLEKYTLETAMFLTASIGLKNTVTTVMYNTMMTFNEADSLPEYPTELFERTLDYLDYHKYHEKFQTNIKSEIHNTVSQRLTSPLIQETLKLRTEIPQWFQEWRQGTNFHIDLTECNPWTKIILANALFQMIKTLTSHLEANTLHNLIVIDEPDILLAKALSTNPYDGMVVAKERLEIVFKELIEEFRSRGVAFIIIDQEPSSLFKCVSKSPALKIVFRLDLEDGRCLTLDEKELNYLKNQRNRYALFFNGATGEEYIIKTLDNDL